MPEAEAGVSIDDDFPVLGACAIQCNTTCDGSLMGNGVISKRLELEDGIPCFQLAAPLRHRDHPECTNMVPVEDKFKHMIPHQLKRMGKIITKRK